MPKEKSKTAKFKIYKIQEKYSINGMLEEIKDTLAEKSISHNNINKKGYVGLIYSNESTPSWINCIHELVSSNIKEKYQTNKNLSYVLFKESSNKTIYGISGGQGYLHLKDYCEKDYGLNLIPKIINNTDDVIRNIVENKLYDNQIYDHRVNRRATNLNLEFEFTNFYKELGLILDKKILKELDLIDDTHFKDLEYVRITNKDYIYIEKSLNLKNLDYIFDWLDSIYQRPLNFELNSFIPISGSENYTPSQILDLLISLIINESKDNYDLEVVGENIVEYLQNDEYIIQCSEIGLKPKEYDYITWTTLEELLKEKNLYDEDSLKSLIKHGILTTTFNGKETLNSNLINCLDCKLYDENTNKDYFLLDGKWYYLTDTFKEIITDKFNNIYENSDNFSKKLIEKYNALKDNWNSLDEKTETNYNETFKDDEDIILFHPLKPDHIEIADLIIYNKENKKLYLICIKDEFSYPGCRDLYGQIKGSYHYIKNDFSKNTAKIDDYYGKISDKNSTLSIAHDEFRKALNGDICYVALFLNKIKSNPTTPIKILTNRIFTTLNHSNVEFYLMNV